MVRAPSSPHDRGVLPLHSTLLSPTLLPAAAETRVCCFLPPARDTTCCGCPHCHHVGQAVGHELWPLYRENPWVQAAASRAHPSPTVPTGEQQGANPPRDPREPPRHRSTASSSPPRAAVAKAGGWCRAPCSRTPRRGSRSEVAAGATWWPLTVASRPARARPPPRGAGTGACRAAGGSRSSGQQQRAHDLLWQVPCSLEPAPSERW